MTADDMMAELVSEQINDIESAVLANDRITLEIWLGPILTRAIMADLGLTELDSDESFISVHGLYEKTFSVEG